MIKDNWYHCPICNGKIFKVKENTVVRNLPAYCKKCKQEVIVNFESQSHEPEPID